MINRIATVPSAVALRRALAKLQAAQRRWLLTIEDDTFDDDARNAAAGAEGAARDHLQELAIAKAGGAPCAIQIDGAILVVAENPNDCPGESEPLLIVVDGPLVVAA